MAQLPGGSRRRPGGVWDFRVWLTAHPVAADTAIAVCLLGSTISHLAVNHQASVAALALAVAVLLPLPLRRRAPEAVFVVVLAVALLALALSQAEVLAAPVVSALLLALYTVAAHRPRRAALICGAGFEVWAVLALLGWIPHGDYAPALFLMTGTATAAVMTGINLQTRRAYLAALEGRAAYLERERDQEARLAAAQERTMIAREVHDIVSHSLTVMTTLADAAAATTATKPERAEGAMRQVAATGRQAISEMGRVLSALRSDDPDAERHPQPGIAQLDDLLAQTRAAGLASRLAIEGRPGNLPGGVQLAVYRIVQESLTNIRKHATGATGAQVRLRYLEESVDLEITDDGQLDGTGPGRAGDGLVGQGLVGHGLVGPDLVGPDLVGHGLVGMRERAAMYGGAIDAGPAPGGGWRVHAVLPAEEAKE